MDIEFFHSLPYAEKLPHVASNPGAAAFAYNRLELHRQSAALQMKRIWEAAARPKPTTDEASVASDLLAMMRYSEEARAWNASVLIEVHFYFVAWANCYRMLKLLTGDGAFLPAKKLFDSHRKEFEHYVHGRNSFEHFEDRLPGRKKEHTVKEVRAGSASPRRIYFGLQGQSYKHSDETWDISPQSLERLTSHIDEVLNPIHRITDSAIEQKFGRH